VENESWSRIVTLSVTIFVVMLLPWLMRRPATRPARPGQSGSEVIIEYGPGLKIVVWVFLAVALGLLLLMSFFAGDLPRAVMIVLSIFSTLFLVGGGTGLLKVRTQVRLAEDGIKRIDSWGRERFIGKENITEVSFSRFHQRFVITDNQGKRIRADVQMRGLSTLIQWFQEHLWHTPALYGEAVNKYLALVDPQQTKEHLRVSFDLVELDTTGWKELGDDHQARYWRNETGDTLALRILAHPPTLPVSLDHVDVLRSFYQKAIPWNGGALIEVNRAHLDRMASLKLITRYPSYPQPQTHTEYAGSFTLPFEKFSIAIEVKCSERGDAQPRRDAVFNKLAAEGRLSMVEGQIRVDDGSGGTVGWTQDPTDPSLQAPFCRDHSEDERYDAQYPDHALSRLRRHLAHLRRTVRLRLELKRRRRFAGPRKQKR
jgi:hypothetical protein